MGKIRRLSNAYHSESICIVDGKSHEAFFANSGTPEYLLIFVHGFNGQAIKTWDQFPAMLLGDSFFSNSDIIFYGYDSLNKQATGHASDLLNFLDHELNFSEDSRSHIKAFSRLRGLDEREYKKVIVIAHSLGAIILREALLQAHSMSSSWLGNISMVLFAPAHMGITTIKDLFFDIMDMSLILKLVAKKIKYDHPILLDLEKNSPILERLQRETNKLIGQGMDFVVAKLVVHASNDKVVSNVQFCQDVRADEVDYKSHSEVCKPAELNYDTPIALIRDKMFSN